MLLNYEYIIIKIICNIITHFTADFAPSKTISFLPVDIYMLHSLWKKKFEWSLLSHKNVRKFFNLNIITNKIFVTLNILLVDISFQMRLMFNVDFLASQLRVFDQECYSNTKKISNTGYWHCQQNSDIECG